tara:strand:- start:4310 stop:5254 length:945 start_codon:yes stop_codon:yes gene_type:complete
MAVRVLGDTDVKNLITMRESVEVMTEAFGRHAAGHLSAPARLASPLEWGQLIFTTGAYSDETGGRIGFRVYDSAHFGSGMRDELVAVFDSDNGALLGLVAGSGLGPLRTGAIGGVAINALAREDAVTLALVGTGKQARTQLQAACEVRSFETIRAHSRNASRCEAFCREMSMTTGVEIQPATSAKDAVAEADVVICSTISDTPVLETDWISPGTHVQNVGPKFQDSCELPRELFESADVLVTDAPAQLADYGDRFLVAGTPHIDRIVSLGNVISGDAPGRTDPQQITLFCSMGLAGTEVALADRLLVLDANAAG